jgi:hypothetical protein
LERETEWGKYIPTEGGRSCHGIAISKSARREHAARRPIGALRRRTIWDHPKECDDPFVGLGVRHLIFPEQTGRWRPVQQSSAHFFVGLIRLMDAPPILILLLSATDGLMRLMALPPILILPLSAMIFTLLSFLPVVEQSIRSATFVG